MSDQIINNPVLVSSAVASDTKTISTSTGQMTKEQLELLFTVIKESGLITLPPGQDIINTVTFGVNVFGTGTGRFNISVMV
jgi:hypothetical protein